LDTKIVEIRIETEFGEGYGLDALRNVTKSPEFFRNSGQEFGKELIGH
jgi:hypothetical protein